MPLGSKLTEDTKDIHDNMGNFAELFEQSIREEKREGTVVKGTIVEVTEKDVLIDVGLKSEGRIPIKEFSLDSEEVDLTVGAEISVYIERAEDRNGNTVLSFEKALREKAWFKIEEFYNKDMNVDGRIIGSLKKGGFAVDLDGIIAFLPGSQVDIRPIRDITPLLNITQPFKVLKMHQKQGNVVVSRRAILEASRAEAKKSLLSNIKEGDILEGTVKNILDYGAFVDLGATDGLIHITDFSWKKITHPSEVVTLGQTLRVMVTKYNEEAQRVSLGLKQLEKNPWEGLVEKYKPGMKITGTVTTVADYGAFVELEPNVEGLVYHTEISWNAKNIHPRKLIKPGDKVEVLVLELDIAKHKISLSIKQCLENPWKTFAENNPINSHVEGTVQNIADFGVFVLLNGENPEASIEALIPTVELSWDDKPENELKNYKKGDLIKAVVLSIDVERERVNLSLRQLTEDSTSSALQKFNKGDTITCTVTAVKKEGVEVEAIEGLKTFIKKNELSKHKSEQRPERFGVGDKIDAQIISLEPSERRIALSIKSLEVDEEKRAIAEYGSKDSGASLGEILGMALNKEKEKK